MSRSRKALDTVLAVKSCQLQQGLEGSGAAKWGWGGVVTVAAGRHGKTVGQQRKGAWERSQRTASGKSPIQECLGSPQEEEFGWAGLCGGQGLLQKLSFLCPVKSSQIYCLFV